MRSYKRLLDWVGEWRLMPGLPHELLRRGLGRLALVAILLVVVAAGAAAYYILAAPPRAGSVRIGFIGPLQTEYGDGAYKALQLAVEEINSGGGVLGRRVEIVAYDDGNNPEQGLAGFRKLVEVDRAVAVFGIHASSVALAILPLLPQYKVPLLAMGATSDVIDANVSSNPGYKYFFRFNINASTHGLIVYDPAKHLASLYGLKRIGLLYDNLPWTAPVISKVKAAAQRDGMEIVYEGTIDAGKTASFVPQLAAARDRGVQILLVWSAYGDGKVLQRDYNDLKPPFAVIQFDGPGMRLSQWNVTGGKLGHQMMVFWAFPGPMMSPKLSDFLAALKQRHGIDFVFYPPYIYDMVHAWKTAVEATGSFDGDAVADYLARNGYQGALARWVFTPGHSPMYGPGYYSPVVVQWRPDGSGVVVWPPGLAAERPRLPPWMG